MEYLAMAPSSNTTDIARAITTGFGGFRKRNAILKQYLQAICGIVDESVWDFLKFINDDLQSRAMIPLALLVSKVLNMQHVTQKL